MALSKFDTTSLNQNAMMNEDINISTHQKAEDKQEVLSIFIPYTRRSTSREMVANAFLMNNIAIVRQVDMIPKENDNGTYYQMFIHLTSWYNNAAANNIRSCLEAGKQARLNYDDPHYWNMYPNTSQLSRDGTDTPRSELIIESLQNENTRLQSELNSSNYWGRCYYSQIADMNTRQWRFLEPNDLYYNMYNPAMRGYVQMNRFDSIDKQASTSCIPGGYFDGATVSHPEQLQEFFKTTAPSTPPPEIQNRIPPQLFNLDYDDASSKHTSISGLAGDSEDIEEDSDYEFMVVPDQPNATSRRLEMTDEVCDNS